MKKIKILSSIFIILGIILSSVPVSAEEINKDEVIYEDSEMRITEGESNILIETDQGITEVVEKDKNTTLLTTNGITQVMITDDDGNVYLDGELIVETIVVETSVENERPLIQGRALSWINAGYYRSNSSFAGLARGTATIALSKIPGWSLASAGIAIANIWLTPKKTVYTQTSYQVRSDGVMKRSRCHTYANSNYTNCLKDSGWGTPWRIHW